ncbi:MAG: hypothetical protein JWO02_32 [Solirubrobacterales bacterium]|nr:hypothetical protein [Solirubrobacterales bacterium]
MIRRTTTSLLTLAALLAFAVPADAAAAMRQATSSNWAGYSVSKTGVRFRTVAGSWVQPAASCTPGQRRYSAYWVGIGGVHTAANALEQIGTQVDCSSTGNAVYAAWYELVPAGPVPIHLLVRPGDKLSAKVTVSGRTVKFYLANRTRGTAFARQVSAKHLDVSTAEWVVEAPSECNRAGCHTLPLADFGSASFAGAKATSTAGHTGAIASPAWSATAISLAPDPSDSGLGSLTARGVAAGARPSDLSASGDGFTVTYGGGPAAAPTPAPVPPASPAPPASPVPPAPPQVGPSPSITPPPLPVLPSPPSITPPPLPVLPSLPSITPAGPAVG